MSNTTVMLSKEELDAIIDTHKLLVNKGVSRLPCQERIHEILGNGRLARRQVIMIALEVLKNKLEED